MIAESINTMHCKPIRRGEVLPSVFCWTKMGSESGQGLDAILQRKELERQSGGGLFSWGIGNSIGPALKHAREAVGSPSLTALFTAMKSAPKNIDVAPNALVIWLGFTDECGSIAKLPEHMLVTSRAHGPSGAKKRSHYALICRRSSPIKTLDEFRRLNSSCVRNLVSAGRVGYSQVTSVVRYNTELAEPNSIAYPVMFDAELAGPWFVRLANPVAIEGILLKMYERACASQSSSDWLLSIKKLKAAAITSTGFDHPTQRLLFTPE